MRPELALQQAADLRNQGRWDAAARQVVDLACGEQAWSLQLQCVGFLKNIGRAEQALQICQQLLQDAPGEYRPLALAQAGSLAQSLGYFDTAREHYLGAIEAGLDLNAWHIHAALAHLQRYTDSGHSDLALFARLETDPRLNIAARTALWFARAKACDDLGEDKQAALWLEQANRQERQLRPWERSSWQAGMERARAWSAVPLQRETQRGRPLFVLGMPRSGTTLLAERLGRHADIRLRGELPFLDYVARQWVYAGSPGELGHLQQAASFYRAHLYQDDAPRKLYLDKNPMNLRYLGLIASLFPDAAVIVCRRQLRDTALSLYFQQFAHADYGFAQDFSDIAEVARDAASLFDQARLGADLDLREVEYEALVTQPQTTLAALLDWLGLDSSTATVSGAAASSIGTASLWQARQDIYTRSMGRWRRYARLLPGLLKLPSSGLGEIESG